MKTKLFILMSFLLAGKIVYSQAIYTMPVTGTQTDTVCGGIFYDSGGPVVNYSNNENGILIFCPAVSGQYVMLEFTSINLSDAGERLRIFSGTDTLGVPLFNLAGPTSSAGCGAIVIANSSGGCLTVHFRSNSTMVAAGWRALLYCVPSPSAIPPPGTDCANPVSIPSLPFMDINQCTECMINDYQTQAGICNTGYAGEDRVYRYTATGTETVCITMSNATTNSTLAVYNGCPGVGGSCITPTPMVGNDTMQVTFPSAGTYYIIVDEPSGFSCYDLSITSCSVGIDDQENPVDRVLIFPNPATSELKIDNAELKIEKVEIYNALGQNVFSQELAAKSQEQINISSLSPGIYFVKVTYDKNFFATRKFVKM